ncbi:hypothetical protein [Pseudomonas putida]|uniref:hypothetical protein n=1 Tax=Pseudomonas putida TaxID=303 RepID=UPI002117A03D|nr:hypothetical protein [Pseudomonas putida]
MPVKTPWEAAIEVEPKTESERYLSKLARKAFKDKNSKDRAAAIAGVRNAAWNITHLSEFIRLVNQDRGAMADWKVCYK